jgi:hypothetical protein
MVDFEVLDWDTSPIYLEGLVRKKEIDDGNCFFHAFIDAFYKPYQMGTIDRKAYIRSLRQELSVLLSKKNANGVMWYQSLSRGKLAEFAMNVPSFTLEAMQAILNSSEYVDNRFNEFVSNVFNKDLYIIDGNTKDLYMTGKDNDILYKARQSIVLIWTNGNHFDLIGILENNKLRTLFDSDHPFILLLRDRFPR